MAKGYLIANIRVHDAEAFEEFKRLSGAAIADYGGKILARDPDADYREGGARGLVTLIEFESPEVAQAFYDSTAYSAARRVREKISQTDLVLVTGL
ncbi:DUF1330 domain-containing protein [Aliiroseovarius sp. KMU-50]|uniref:DUF1330 domain-containing protein n=1 Tax=Aliiroseovarius salicola TaxID=3009082 RepID=A0ABT4W1A8_9RHOB|nr:DUF1330 domain-containing protein [Aliiroseovarius sp. KMU-50]MDA5094289.1 DUF1330 domain-containing protein [Aliiroseovarius sp. KMU-50]